MYIRKEQKSARMLKILKNVFAPKQEPDMTGFGDNARDVGEFYNATTDKFLQVYGDVIQAFRTTDISVYLDYTIKNAELGDNQIVLDAGCGIGGPSAYFATKLNSRFEGVTASITQVEKAKLLLSKKQLAGTVNIQHGDYHQIDKIYGEEVFDRILFLESFGHSTNKPLLIEKAYKALKPGGILYIKDLFIREFPNEDDGEKITRIVEEINKAYHYQVADLHDVLRAMRKLNFLLLFVKTPEVKSGEFEHLTISNDFQNLFDIAKIITWENYVFPVDFYEIKVMKPTFDVNAQKHLYFLNRPD